MARSGSTPAPTLLRRRARLLQRGEALFQRLQQHARTQELQLAAGPAEQPLRFCGGADPVERAVEQFVEAVLGQPQRVEHRAREKPVQQHELDDAAGVEHAAIGAQVGVVCARRAQHRHPRR